MTDESSAMAATNNRRSGTRRQICDITEQLIFWGCHAGIHNRNTFISIGLETRSRTVALRVRCRFDSGLSLYRLNYRSLRNHQAPFFLGPSIHAGSSRDTTGETRSLRSAYE